jgi:colanic acid biosynthesis glycosyl transferase WcaI
MRVLLVNNLFQPEPNHLKGLAFARELQRRGHYVHVLTVFPNYPGGRLYPGYRMRWAMHETLDGVPVTRVAMYPSHDASAGRRILNYVSTGLSQAIRALTMRERFDVCHVYMGPITLMWPAWVLKRMRGTRVIADVQDPWPESVADSGMLGSGLALRLLEAVCRRSYHWADRSLAVSPGVKRLLCSQGIDPDTIDVVYNWCDESHLGAAAEPNAPPGVLPAGTFNVVYAGNLGALQGLDTVVDAARLLAARGVRASFVLIGAGVEAERIGQRIRMERLDNIRIVPRMPAQQVNRILARSDVLLIHLVRSRLSRVAIPQKVQAYLAAGRPILLAVEGDSLDLFRQTGAGLACEPESAEAMAQTVERFMKLDAGEREEMGRRGRRFYKDVLSFQKGVDHIESLFTRVTQEPDCSGR